jgi:hypothetical protein
MVVALRRLVGAIRTAADEAAAMATEISASTEEMSASAQETAATSQDVSRRAGEQSQLVRINLGFTAAAMAELRTLRLELLRRSSGEVLKTVDLPADPASIRARRARIPMRSPKAPRKENSPRHPSEFRRSWRRPRPSRR